MHGWPGVVTGSHGDRDLGWAGGSRLCTKPAHTLGWRRGPGIRGTGSWEQPLGTFLQPGPVSPLADTITSTF